ncbi:TPA: hypothetical protein ACT5B2_005246 [Burkholderia cenocepacia]|uniref:hypothetical protein n=1 Tax=Burkholderia cenocepacia TaxID=95486 RepID=UPI0001D2396A|nr:hypothetical protein [Burkholderia cenocepacia]EIF29954.1 hypothetical protein BCh11DRAFT_05414 [Burkholderia sp. Ch1-1]
MSHDTQDFWVVYSPNESATSHGSGFWSNELGWVEFGQATCFSTEETRSLALPLSLGRDALYVPRHEAELYYG